MNFRKPLSSIGIGAIAVIIGLGVQYAAAQWSAAPTAPPGNNVAAPINVSSANQAKAGALTLGSATDEASQASSSLYVAGMGGIENLFAGWLTVTGTTTLDGRIYIARGLSTTSGTVLTNNGQGYASWQPLPGAAPGASGWTFFSPDTIFSGGISSGNNTIVNGTIPSWIPTSAHLVLYSITGNTVTGRLGPETVSYVYKTSATNSTSYQVMAINDPDFSDHSEQVILPISYDSSLTFTTTAGTTDAAAVTIQAIAYQ